MDSLFVSQSHTILGWKASGVGPMGLGQKFQLFHLGWLQHGLLGSTGIHNMEDHCWASLSNPGIFPSPNLVMSLLGFPKMKYNIQEDKSIIFSTSQIYSVAW